LKLKQKKLDARLNNIKLGPSRKELKHSKMSQSNCKVRVAIDLSFDDLMNDKVHTFFNELVLLAFNNYTIIGLFYPRKSVSVSSSCYDVTVLIEEPEIHCSSTLRALMDGARQKWKNTLDT